MYAAGLAAHEGRDFAQPGAVELDIQIDALRRHEPAPLHGEGTEALRGTVGAGQFGGTGDPPPAPARTGRRDVQIRLGEVEHRFHVAELEVDAAVAQAAVANVDGGGGAQNRRVHQRREVPAAPLGGRAGLGEVDAGAFQPDGSNHELAAEKRPETGRDIHAVHVGHGLDADGGVLVNHHVLHREPGTFEQTEPHRAEKLDAPSEGTLERSAQALAVPLGAQVGRHNARNEQQRQRPAGEFQKRAGPHLHAPPPVRPR